MSASAGPPSPSVRGVTKTEETVQTMPVARPPPMPTTFQHFVPAVMNAAAPMPNGSAPQYPQPLPQAAPPLPPPQPKKSATDILEAQKYRPHPISK